MRTKAENYWYRLRNGFWFVPSVMALFGVGLAYGIGRADHAAGYNNVSFIYGGTSSGARSVLVAIAGSMITVAGTVFSITIVSLSLMSQQFGPRVLRNFMRNLGNQIVLGTFIATFLYCIVVLREVRGGDVSTFVPGISITIAVLLAIASIAVLIYFIHHVATSIQATEIVAAVGADLNRTIDRLFNDREGVEDEREADAGEIARRMRGSRDVTTASAGYIQAIDQRGLMEVAESCDVIIEIVSRPGHFVTRETVIARVAPAARADASVDRRVKRAVIAGSSRTLEQDVEYAVEQLVQIALHALSPSLNDSFTAVRCIDQIGDALVHLMQKQLVETRVYRSGEAVRLIMPGSTFPGVADAALRQIRQNGAQNPAIAIRLLDMLAMVGVRARSEEHRDTIERQARMIRDAAHEVRAPQDRQDVERRFDLVMESLRSSIFNPTRAGGTRASAAIRRSPA